MQQSDTVCATRTLAPHGWNVGFAPRGGIESAKSLLIVTALLTLAAPLAQAIPLVLYDVDFDESVVGQPVVAVAVDSAPDFGRTFPTSAPAIAGYFEPPTVIASVGGLTNQPALFAPQIERSSQLGFEIGGRVSLDSDCVLAGGSMECLIFDPSRDRYIIEMDILPITLSRPFASTGGFRILLDNPRTQSIDFTSDGTIGVLRSSSSGASYTAIGSFDFGLVARIKVVVDFQTELLSIFKDDTLLVADTWDAQQILELTNVRLGLSDQLGEVAVDNLRIVAVPEPSIGAMLFLGLTLLVGRKRTASRRH